MLPAKPMNDAFVFIYFFLFAIILGASFAFMWKSMTYTFEEMNKPPIKRTVHPEMSGVENGTELLVFKAEDDDDEDDTLIVRK